MEDTTALTPRDSTHPHSVSFGEAFRVWLKVAAYSFGGPAGQIAVMHRLLVEEKRWVSENRFLHALNYCMLLPGPEAQQLATYIGWLLHRTWGGLVAGTLFVLPGFLSILALSILYARYREITFVEGLFYGLKPAVVAVVVAAVIRIGERALKNSVMIAIAALAFIGIFFFNVPFPLIIILAGLGGFIGGRIRQDKFLVIASAPQSQHDDPENRFAISDEIASEVRPTTLRALGTGAFWILVWFGPVAALAAWLGGRSVYVTEAIFFSKAALVTFGGAYAVLAYVAQQAVDVYGWLLPGEMLDGIGMAETTPGPLIQVVQFVGFMGAYRNPDPLHPLWAGLVGSVITTWVTFVPSFLWIFLGAPYMEHLRGNKSLSTALSAITAAVVGVILNLAIWFSLHTVFSEIEELRVGIVRLWIPDPTSVDLIAATISVGAFIALLRFRTGLLSTLAASAGFGLICYLILIT